MQRESFDKKLFIARDVEGNPNDRELKIIRELEGQLSKNKSFVGIAPFGSVVGGYGTRESDIDLFILYDQPRTDDLDEMQYTSGIVSLRRQVFAWQEEMEKSGQKVDIVFQNVNTDSLTDSIKFWLKERGDLGEYVPLSLEAMSRMVTGKKIGQYRKALAVKLGELDQEQKIIVIDTIVKSLLKRDGISLSKRERRMPKLSREDHQGILNEREIMWRNLVQKIWNL